MTTDNLFKQVANFERKVQQLDKCNDSMSDRDWTVLEEKLEQLPDACRKMAKLASVFSKIAVDDTKPGNADDLLLKPNENQKRSALSEKSNWIVDMEPGLFIRMTTPHFKAFCEVIDESKPLDFYLSEEINKDMSVHPFLNIDQATGKIRGHEGRHRAAAVLKKGGKWFRVALHLKPSGRSYRPKDMPMSWIGEFDSDRYDIKNLMQAGKIKVVNDSVQKEFWRDDDDDSY
jgi:hypothetical protein